MSLSLFAKLSLKCTRKIPSYSRCFYYEIVCSFANYRMVWAVCAVWVNIWVFTIQNHLIYSNFRGDVNWNRLPNFSLAHTISIPGTTPQNTKLVKGNQWGTQSWTCSSKAGEAKRAERPQHYGFRRNTKYYSYLFFADTDISDSDILYLAK